MSKIYCCDIEIWGKTRKDIECAIKEIVRLIEEKCSVGFDENDTGGFSYVITPTPFCLPQEKKIKMERKIL